MTKNMNCEYEQPHEYCDYDFIIVKCNLFIFVCLYIRSFDGLECIRMYCIQRNHFLNKTDQENFLFGQL